MKSVIVASALVFLVVEPAGARLTSCEIFDRSNTHAPQFVRDYLDGSKEPLVRVCGGNRSHYLGAGNPVRDGNVCRYLEYGLNLSRTSPPRLERNAAPPQTYMLVSESSACPSPVAIKYTATNDVPQDVFEHLVQVWHDAISSPASSDRTFSRVSDAAVLLRLRNAILQGKSNRLTVVSVAIGRDLGLWKSYDLEVADPDYIDQFYNVTVSSWFGRTYRISDVRADLY